MFELREYQKQALGKILWAKGANLEGGSICVVPTGGGKSLIIAALANALKEPILILVPTREILSQNLEKLCRYVDRQDIGVYSASMNEKTIKHFTFGTIGSVCKKSELFSHFKLVIIDECDLVPVKNMGSMFMTFLKKIGFPAVIGFTATPYRLDTTYIRTEETDSYYNLKATIATKLINRMKGFFWKRILFNIGISDLMEKGYLCPLKYEDFSVIQHSEIPVNKSESDFDLDGYEKKIATKSEQIRKAIAYAESCSKSVLVFCSSVSQAEKLAQETVGAAVVSAKTPSKERDQIINDFRTHKIKTVFNVGVLTLGFDHQALDAILLLRPTRSIRLYYQMCGRGLRISPGKEFCRIIDLTSTVKNLGKIETINLIRKERWELESETENGVVSWHNFPLYSYLIEKEKKSKQNDLFQEIPATN